MAGANFLLDAAPGETLNLPMGMRKPDSDFRGCQDMRTILKAMGIHGCLTFEPDHVRFYLCLGPSSRVVLEASATHVNNSRSAANNSNEASTVEAPQQCTSSLCFLCADDQPGWHRGFVSMALTCDAVQAHGCRLLKWQQSLVLM